LALLALHFIRQGTIRNEFYGCGNKMVKVSVHPDFQTGIWRILYKDFQ